MVVQRGRNTPHRGKWMSAVTRFSTSSKSKNGMHLWQAMMCTGVMHQIRLHAAIAGLALVEILNGGGATPATSLVTLLSITAALSLNDGVSWLLICRPATRMDPPVLMGANLL